MSFVPAPQQANVASANNSNNNKNNEVALKSTTNNAAAAAAAAAAEAAEGLNDDELIFKMRTFDVYWVDKYALMYKAGIDKVRYLFEGVAVGGALFAVVLWARRYDALCLRVCCVGETD